MSIYAKDKKKLDYICRIYNSTSNIIMRTAIQIVLEYGQRTCSDNAWYADQIKAIDDCHDQAEAKGEILIVTRDFEKTILKCVKEFAQFPSYDLLIYLKELL